MTIDAMPDAEAHESETYPGHQPVSRALANSESIDPRALVATTKARESLRWIPEPIRRLLGPMPYVTVGQQVEADELLVAVAQTLNLKQGDILLWLFARDLVISEMSVRLYRRALKHVVKLAERDAALEVLEPGWNEAFSRVPKTDPSGSPVWGFMQCADQRLTKLGLAPSDSLKFRACSEETRLAALGELSRNGLPEEALHDQALQLRVAEVERLEKLIAINLAARDMALSNFERREDRLRLITVVEIVPEEIEE